MGDNATDEMKRLLVVEVEASRIQSSLLYVTRLLTAMQSQAIACDLEKITFLSRLSEFLKMHREQEAGQKVCLKCFFTTTVNRFHLGLSVPIPPLIAFQFPPTSTTQTTFSMHLP